MNINYDIFSILNAEGEGKERKFVKLKQGEPLTDEQLGDRIEKGSSLTRGDVLAVFSALSRFAVQELSCGHRFHVPGLGYLSLSAEINKEHSDLPEEDIRGNYIRLRGINFQPEKQLVNEVAENVHFVRSRQNSRSAHYTETDMWERVNHYLDNARFITRRSMQGAFKLTRYAAQKWLTLFVQKGLLVKDGTPDAPAYFKATT